MRLTPKNWRDFQHYKDRNPPWIRLHRALLDNKDFNSLPPIACKVLVLLWLVAADNTDGVFDDNADELAFRLRMPVEDVSLALHALKERDFLRPADAVYEDDEGIPLSKQIAKRNGYGSRHISDSTKRDVYMRDGGKCCACGSTENLEFDHIHPVSKGGNSELGNIQLLCRPCNRRKRAKTSEQVATHAQPWLDLRTSETEAETETEAEKREKKKRVPRPQAVACAAPEDVSVSVWCDWLELRKQKRASVTQTVIEGARAEAKKAGLSLEGFLRIWCLRGSQGLEASWIKPEERAQHSGETAYQRSMREKYEKVAPAIAAKAPGQQPTPVVFDFEAIDAKPITAIGMD